MMKTVHVINKFLLILFLTISCKNKNVDRNSLELQYSYEIYSQLLNGHKYLDFVGLLPPPLSEFTTDFTEEDFKNKIDSLKQVYQDSVLRIALYPTLFPLEIEKKYESENNTYNPYKLTAPREQLTIDTSRLTYNKSMIYLSLLDTIQNTKVWNQRFKSNHIILSFSKVAFTHDFKRAVLISGLTISKVDGFSSVIYLERKNCKWGTMNYIDKDVKVIYDTFKKGL